MTARYPGKSHYQSDEVAESYDAVRFRSWRGRLVDRLEKGLILRGLRGVESGASVLDLPTGTGRIARMLAERGYRVIGGDISHPMLRRALEQSRSAPLVVADGESVPFVDGAFDAVVSVRLMHHVPPNARAAILREFARISRGVVVATFADAQTLQAILRKARAAHDPGRMPIYPITRQQGYDEATAAGLRPIGDWGLLPWYASTRVFALKAGGRQGQP